MAEPVGITGTAVGIVSLGLQLYTGISDYLDAVKGRDDDLRQAKEYAKTLQASLRAIEDALTKTRNDCSAAKDAVEECKNSCEAELKALGALLKELQGPVVAPVDRIAQAKSSLRKWSYPFNKRDIAKLENRLISTNEILQTALMALQLRISNSAIDVVSGLQQTVETVQMTAEMSNKTIVAQSKALEQVSQTSTRIYQEVLALRDARTEEVRAYLHEAGSPNRQIAQLVASPQDLRRMCDTALSVPRYPEPESTVPASYKSGGSAATQPFCLCAKRRNLRRNRSAWGPLFFETELARTDFHASECPMSGITSTKNKNKRTVGVDIPALRKILGRAVRISLSLTVGAGGSSCGQNIAWVATVREYSSPPFRIMSIMIAIFDAVDAKKSMLRDMDMQTLVESCWRRLRLCYTNKQASPTDVNEVGEPIMEWFLWEIVGLYISMSDDMARLIRLLASLNVPANCGHRGRKVPLVASITENFWFMQTNTARETLAALLSCCTESAGSGHQVTLPTIRRRPHQMKLLGVSPETAEHLEFNPLSIAIMREDDEYAQNLLEKYPSYSMETDYCGQSPVYIAIQMDNFRILSLMIQSVDVDIVNAADNSHYYPIDYATHTERHRISSSGEFQQVCNACRMIELLLGSNSVLLQASLHRAFAQDGAICKDAQRSIIRHLAIRRKGLEQLAISNLSSTEVQDLGLGRGWVLDRNAAKAQQYLEARSYHIPKHLMVYDKTGPPEHEKSIYACIQDVELAEYAMTLGFDADTVFVDVFHRLVRSVIHRYEHCIEFDWSLFPLYIFWVMDRGADIASVVPMSFVPGVVQNTTWAHYLMAFFETRWRWGLDQNRVKQETKRLSKMLETLIPLRECRGVGYDWIYRGILRYLTFIALGLRHTCCLLENYGSYQSPDAEELEEIHQEDSVTLQLLEGLVEEFEAGCGSNANLTPFIRDTWVPRMREVDAELSSQKLTEEEFRKAEECGVEWIDRGDEVSSSSDTDEDLPFLEYWMRELDEIAIDPQRPLYVG
ncbi:hypothetical protein NM208_g7235 [Fusarium decemcellulare]|uniref:Uncharacterized protein n=1 Tax=Fusarium decemcellulare TaxID=57161 RepID=A0ACC1SA27_9HYPO|nr:hypothetical protein NM208_g7235 [Fusarium decemcellulare]